MAVVLRCLRLSVRKSRCPVSVPLVAYVRTCVTLADSHCKHSWPPMIAASATDEIPNEGATASTASDDAGKTLLNLITLVSQLNHS